MWTDNMSYQVLEGILLVSLFCFGYINGEVVILTDNEGCYNGETSNYTGTISTTQSGQKCKHWDEVKEFSDDDFPDGSICEAKNYCRDPNGFGYLWCYVDDSDLIKDKCNITSCVIENKHVHDCYVVTDKDTESGKSVKEICESRPGGRRVCEGSKHIPTGCEDCEDCCQKKDCHNGCIREYSGTWHRTVSGRQCQNWNSQYPHTHPHNESHMFPEDESVIDAHNYCRDPDGSESLWCYTTDPYKRRENCGIPEC